jgi:hypothetical protein
MGRHEPPQTVMLESWHSLSSQSMAPSPSLSSQSEQRSLVPSGLPSGLQCGSAAQSLSSMSDEDGTPRQPPFDPMGDARGGALGAEDTPEHMAVLARRLAEPERPRLSQARPSHRARLIDEANSVRAADDGMDAAPLAVDGTPDAPRAAE